MYKVPCGNNMGHGSSCTEGYLCNACLHIEELEAELENFRSDAYVLSLLTKLDELEAQLEAVRWTKITHNPATHPPLGVPVMVIGGLPYFMDIVDHVSSISTFEPEKINGWMGKQWRPLCSFDYPPEAAIKGDEI